MSTTLVGSRLCRKYLSYLTYLQVYFPLRLAYCIVTLVDDHQHQPIQPCMQQKDIFVLTFFLPGLLHKLCALYESMFLHMIYETRH